MPVAWHEHYLMFLRQRLRFVCNCDYKNLATLHSRPKRCYSNFTAGGRGASAGDDSKSTPEAVVSLSKAYGYRIRYHQDAVGLSLFAAPVLRSTFNLRKIRLGPVSASKPVLPHASFSNPSSQKFDVDLESSILSEEDAPLQKPMIRKYVHETFFHRRASVDDKPNEDHTQRVQKEMAAFNISVIRDSLEDSASTQASSPRNSTHSPKTRGKERLRVRPVFSKRLAIQKFSHVSLRNYDPIIRQCSIHGEERVKIDALNHTMRADASPATREVRYTGLRDAKPLFRKYQFNDQKQATQDALIENVNKGPDELLYAYNELQLRKPSRQMTNNALEWTSRRKHAHWSRVHGSAQAN